MKRTNQFYKTLSLSSPYQNESEIENNRNNPMLFKMIKIRLIIHLI